MMSPLFLLRREKYASGFKQRLGNYPEFKPDGRKVIWLHCVSVGETNAARPLVDQLLTVFSDHRIIISTTTKTGQELAQKIFRDKADAIIYFPFDWKFSVRKALNNYKPTLVLLMETEIWPRFIHEAKLSGAKVAIVNGRLSERSFRRYSKVRPLINRVLADVDLALMQGEADSRRIISLGLDTARATVTGNLKFDHALTKAEDAATVTFRDRFAVQGDKLFIIAASTHEPEERLVVQSLDGELGHTFRLLIVPRHPERFEAVAAYLTETGHAFVRRSGEPTNGDKTASIILLDSIGELRAAYPLADIVFVGGSLIPHGGQSVLEPAIDGKAIVTGPHTANFHDVVKDLLDKNAIIQIPTAPDDDQASERLYEAFMALVDEDLRNTLGQNAAAVMHDNRGATDKTVDLLKPLLSEQTES